LGAIRRRPGAGLSIMFTPCETYTPVSSDLELNSIHTSKAAPTMCSSTSSWRRKHLKGWHISILTGACLATTVLIINIAVTVVNSKHQRGDDPGRRLLFEGDCSRAEQLNVVAHLVINVLSTILLSASNYGMQVLSAPTRKEVDVAHASRRWLDIGVLSVRNLKSISWMKGILWACLGLSSLPLHLL
jgi:hypothetical protein